MNATFPFQIDWQDNSSCWEQGAGRKNCQEELFNNINGGEGYIKINKR